MRKIIFKCLYPPGDVVMLTTAVRELHQQCPGAFLTDVRTRWPDLWRFNPYLTSLRETAPSVTVLDCEYPLVNRSNRVGLHCLNGFIQFFNQKLGLELRLTACKGDIHLSPEEKVHCHPVRERLGAELPYWIVVGGGKYDCSIKWWDWKRFQEVVDHYRNRLFFVQTGRLGDYHPKLKGALDLRGKTTLRQLIHLVYHARGVLCPVTLMQHLAAAVEVRDPLEAPRPCVVVAGGREPPHWEAYPGHKFLHTVGELDCCKTGGCWRARTASLGDGSPRDRPEQLCVDVTGGLPRCMDRIQARQVIQAMDELAERGKRVCLTPGQAGIIAEHLQREPANPFEQQPLSVPSVRLAICRAMEDIPPPPRAFNGRGIVICAGGVKYFTNAWITIHMLRWLGCRLPIQLWHLGPDELDGRMAAMLAPLEVECIDAFKVREIHPVRTLKGWELKAFALVYCPFSQVLLDPDNLPVVNPGSLFDCDSFGKWGAVFWPDYPGAGAARETLWRLCNLDPPRRSPFESGQVLVDKAVCWEPLRLSLWINEYSDFFYRFLHGDKDTFNLAWQLMDRSFAMPPKGPANIGGRVMAQFDFSRGRVFQHRNMAKWDFWGDNPAIPDFWFESECRGFLESLQARWDGEIHPGAGVATASRGQATLQVIADRMVESYRVGHDEYAITIRPGRLPGLAPEQGEGYWEFKITPSGLGLEASLSDHEKARFAQDDRGRLRAQPLDSIATSVLAKRLPVPSASRACLDRSRPARRGAPPVRIQPVMISCQQRDVVRKETLRRFQATDWSGPDILIEMDAKTSEDLMARIRVTTRRAIARGVSSRAEYLLFVEDDLIFNLFLERNLKAWAPLKSGRLQFASLYNPGVRFQRQCAGENYLIADPRGVFGAQALLMSRAFAQIALDRWDDSAGMPDLALPRLAASLGQPVYYHAPSLVQHSGDPSTWSQNYRHKARDFDRWWRDPSLFRRRAHRRGVPARQPCLAVVASRPARYYSHFRESCRRLGIDPHILGYGQPYANHGVRVLYLRQLLNEFRGRFSHLICCDAFDVVFAKGLEEMMVRYSKLGAPIVFSAERNCFPDPTRASLYPEAATPYRYLNAGFWIAEWEPIRRLLDQVPEPVGSIDDQGLYTELFLAHPELIRLDSHASLCQSLFQSGKDLTFDARRGEIVNHLTGEAPCAFHANGHSDLDPVLQWLRVEG